MSERPVVAFIGLGAMGSPMARRLLDAGYPVLGYNRTRARAQELAPLGLEVCESPRQAAEGAALIVTMVRDDRALQAVSEGAEGLLAGAADATWIEMSTVTPQLSESLADAAAQQGLGFLQAPVSGSVPHAQAGELTIIAAGSQQAFAAAQPVLSVLGSVVKHVGPLSNALYLKLAINLSIAIQTIGFAEGLVFAERSGIDRQLAVDVLLSSAIASPMLKGRGRLALERAAEAWFDVGLMQKDLEIALGHGREQAVPLPLSSLSNQLLTATRAAGLGEQDVIAVYDLLRQLAGGNVPVA